MNRRTRLTDKIEIQLEQQYEKFTHTKSVYEELDFAVTFLKTITTHMIKMSLTTEADRETALRKIRPCG